MARKHEEEENYWPGFVDALSTIVMVVTLLMIILVIVIFSISQLITQSSEDSEKTGNPIAVSQQAQPQPQNEQTIGTPETQKSDIVRQEEIVEAQNSLQIQSRKIIDEKTIIVASEEKTQEDKENQIKVESAQQILTVHFMDTGVELSKEAKEEISQYLEENRKELEYKTLTAWSFYDPNSIALSQAKRKAYFRLLAVRNILIEKGFTGENLTVNVRPAKSESEIDRVLVFVK